jgi:two-component system NtrC family sensor kinase
MDFATFSSLIAGLAHEINTPLGALHSNHDVLMRALRRLQAILADEVVEPDELEEVRRIVRAINEVINVNTMAVERVGSLVKDLRNFGRPDRYDVGYADLHEGIDSSLAIIRHELGDRIQVVRDYSRLPGVLCRPQQLNQVWLNLLVNATQAIPERGTITLRTSASGGNVTIAVSDTGAGIEEAHQARVFEPGFTTKGGRVGMGMGLLIARQVVQQHGGMISVESQLGRGTTFTVVLPIEPEGMTLPQRSS